MWLSVIACWCFFPRKWLNKYTSDGIWNTTNVPLSTTITFQFTTGKYHFKLYTYQTCTRPKSPQNAQLHTNSYNRTMTLQTMHNFFFSYGTSFGASLWSSVECRRILMRNAFSCIASSFSLCLRSVSSCYTPQWQNDGQSIVSRVTYHLQLSRYIPTINILTNTAMD